MSHSGGGGFVHSLASVSTALSHYFGGTVIWTVAPSVRLLSEYLPPPANPISFSATARHSIDNYINGSSKMEKSISTYEYSAVSALRALSTSSAATSIEAGNTLSNYYGAIVCSSPIISLLTVMCWDMMRSNRYYCCAALLSSLIGGSYTARSSIAKELVKVRILELYSLRISQVRPAVNRQYDLSNVGEKIENKDNDINDSRNDGCQNDIDIPIKFDGHSNQRNDSCNIREKAAAAFAAVIRVFKLENFVASTTTSSESPSIPKLLRKKLSQLLQLPFLKQRCEKEMLGVHKPQRFLDGSMSLIEFETYEGETKGDILSQDTERDAQRGVDNESLITLVATDVAKNVLAEEYSIRHLSQSLCLDAAKITATSIRLQSLNDGADHVDVHHLESRSRSKSFAVRTQPAVRVLPQTLHAVSNIEIGTEFLKILDVPAVCGREIGKTSFDSQGVTTYKNLSAGASSRDTTSNTICSSLSSTSDATVLTLIHSLCVGFLLCGDVDVVILLLRDLLGRKDIARSCIVMRDARTRTRSRGSQSAAVCGPRTSVSNDGSGVGTRRENASLYTGPDHDDNNYGVDNGNNLIDDDYKVGNTNALAACEKVLEYLTGIEKYG